MEPDRVPGADPASIFLRHTYVPDGHGDGLQRKLKNVVQSAKRGWQRDVRIGCSDLVWGEKLNRCRLVGIKERPAAVMLPVDAETSAMCAPLPRHGIVEVEAPAEIEVYCGPSDVQAGSGNVDLGRTD